MITKSRLYELCSIPVQLINLYLCMVFVYSRVCDISGVLSYRYPTMPNSCPPTVLITLLLKRPSIGSRVASIFAQTTSASTSFKNSASLSGPRSNSWFPNACMEIMQNDYTSLIFMNLFTPFHWSILPIGTFLHMRNSRVTAR